MTTTNPVNMSVLPTDGQCLVEDGVNDFSVAGQFTPASSFVDSYQLCDPNDKCFVVGVGVAEVGIAELARRAFVLKSQGMNAEAAAVYEELGKRYEARGIPGLLVDAVEDYREAAQLYRAAGNLVKSADVYSVATQVALKAGLNIAFDLIGSTADACLDAARIAGITRGTKFLYYSKANTLLQHQADIVLSERGTGTVLSHVSYRLEISIYTKQLEALKGARSNDPTFGQDTAAGRTAYLANVVERANVYERKGDAHVVLGQLGLAAKAYSQQYEHLLEALSSGEEILARITAFETKFPVAKGSVIDASDVSGFSSIIRQVLANKEQEARVEQALLRLASGGGSEREMDRVVRLFERSYVGRERQGMEELTGNEGWLGQLEHAAERAGKGEIISTFRTRARGVFGAKGK